MQQYKIINLRLKDWVYPSIQVAMFNPSELDFITINLLINLPRNA